MWDRNKQQRLDGLGALAEHGTLPPELEREIERLFQELDEEEEAKLRPANERLEHDQAGLRGELSHVQAQNSTLLALAARYDDLLMRAKVQLAVLASERHMLREELARTLR